MLSAGLQGRPVYLTLRAVFQYAEAKDIPVLHSSTRFLYGLSLVFCSMVLACVLFDCIFQSLSIRVNVQSFLINAGLHLQGQQAAEASLQQATSSLNQQQHSLQQQHAQQAQHAQQLADHMTRLREECAVLTQHKGVAETSAAAATQQADCAGTLQPSACCIVNQSINQSVNKTINQSVSQSVSQPVSQSVINQ